MRYRNIGAAVTAAVLTVSITSTVRSQDAPVQGQTTVTPLPGQTVISGQAPAGVVQTQANVPNLQPGVDVSAAVSANVPDQARYRWVNGHWWYLMPSGHWMIWVNNQWTAFDPATYNPQVFSRPNPQVFSQSVSGTYPTYPGYGSPLYTYDNNYWTPGNYYWGSNYGYGSPYYGGGYGWGGYGRGGYGYPGYGFGYGYPGYGYYGGTSPFYYQNPGGAIVGGNVGSAIGGQIGGGQGAAIGGGIGAAIGGNQPR